MTQTRTLTIILKRAALLSAANWPVTAVQFIADLLFKILIAVPIFGGALIVGMLIEREGGVPLSGDLRDMLAAVASALWDQPVALAAFLAAFGIVLVGGSAFMFLVKGGTVTVLACADRGTGAIELEPLRFSVFRRASRFSAERFTNGSATLFRRFLRLGLILIGVYAVSVTLYMLVVFGGYHFIGERVLVLGWTVLAGIGSSALVVWITLVNLLYLLTQVVIAVDDCSVRNASRRVLQFLHADLRHVAAVFGAVLVMVMFATLASMLTTAGLGLIAFVPLAGLAVLPLQLVAWLLRNLVFQYLGLTALSAYLGLYRSFAADATSHSRAPRRPGASYSRAS
jgi:hypothetical protein